MSVGVVSADLQDFLGETVDNGRFKLIERLGSGAFGVVYKALDTSSPIDNPIYYAVKCMKKEAVGTREAVFQVRELKLQKMVSPPLNSTSPVNLTLFLQGLWSSQHPDRSQRLL